MKRLGKGLVVLMLIATLVVSGNQMLVLHAAENNTTVDDPEEGRANGNIDKGFYGDIDSDSSVANYSKGRSGTGALNGIDVSVHNGTINWSQAHQAGAQFAFVRVGYRGSTSGSIGEDGLFRKNLSEAVAAGVPVGAYFFSQAINESEAAEEANYICDRLSGYNISLPVVIDYEYASGGGRLYDAHLSKDAATSVVNTFNATVSARGYTPMVYANKNMLDNQLNASAITSQVWLAHYTEDTNYGGSFSFWQHSSKGSGAGYGCSSEYVDLDYWMRDVLAMNRLYNPNTGEHFYTANSYERDNLVSCGWRYEGIGWYASSSGDAVYRLYNPNAGDHHYTLNTNEVNSLVAAGWRYEGVAFYSDPYSRVPLYRCYNPNAKAGAHNYTANLNENNMLCTHGWRFEGVSWYGVN